MALAAVFLGLAACSGTPGLVRPNEPVKVQRIFEVRSPIEWARFRGLGNETWTIDGALLNRLTFITNIRDKEHIFGYGRQNRWNPDGAFYRTGMDPNELRDLMVDGLAQIGFANVSASNLQPGERDGFTTYQFDLDLRSPNGLTYKGHVLMLERRQRLNFVLFYAPVEYYYAKDADAVTAIFADLHVRP
ncbi:hypothetical protein C7S18_10685 [Ahniella affigens]|uniref:DUF1795 domain-containing protein n=1 Tax=Ahniella affigens TaxID=2021234 RepID=A0A2P1PS30_9GAMM|nr:hypothetical protein C7S18_10685 [Ahniella affigens]